MFDKFHAESYFLYCSFKNVGKNEIYKEQHFFVLAMVYAEENSKCFFPMTTIFCFSLSFTERVIF